jgi:ParB family chromosome partitioning protein
MVKKRGLGKHLDALLVGSYASDQTTVTTTSQSNETLAYLPLDIIQRGKYQPRRTLDPVALEELANSIRAQGIIQPIVVRSIANDRYEIIAGERRWRAAQLAELTEIPALVRDIPDSAAVAIALIENIQRENLNPIEESLALQRLMDEFDMTHQQCATAVGKSRATITNLLRLLTLAPDVREMVEKGELEMGHARALLSLSPDLQHDAASKIILKGLSVREAEQLARDMLQPRTESTTTQKPLDPDIKRLQQDLTHKLRLKVAIQCNPNGKGKLVIQYDNLVELDKLLEFFH